MDLSLIWVQHSNLAEGGFGRVMREDQFRDAVAAIEQLRKTAVETPLQPQPFGWWDQFNEVLHRSEAVAKRCVEGGNTITPLYAKAVP